MIFAGYETPLAILKHEVNQKQYEGCSVPKALLKDIQSLDDAADAMDFSAVHILYSRLEELEADQKFPYIQPNDLAGIRRERPVGPRKLETIKQADLLDRLHGAWTGRAVGCALGKPVEGMGIVGQKGMNGRKAIRAYLINRGDWPLDDYISGAEIGDGLKISCPNSQRENIAYMEPDDDIHYTLIAIKVLEAYGPNFTWRDVATTWNQSLPYYSICTAEAQAIMNYNNAVPRKTQTNWVTAEFTSTHRNPYREWIGAQIRADGWGYACAGHPEMAAEYAYRDACWTHRANGIYGEMMFAAIIAAAFIITDPIDLVEIGLSEIPKNCKLAEACRAAIKKIKVSQNFEDYMDWVEQNYGHLHSVHTVNNALVVIGALVFGKTDFHRSICKSIEGGWDTDCNGATCGSIVGSIHGISNSESKLIGPLNDTIKPLVFGFQEITMAELAQRTLKIYNSIQSRV